VKPDWDMTPAGFRTIVHIDALVRAVSRQQARANRRGVDRASPLR